MASDQKAQAIDERPPLVVTSFDDLNFLVIDDEGVTLELLEGLLKSASVGSVKKASSVFSAVGVLADSQTKIDCIICDHHMEGMTGLALLQRIRAGRNAIVPRDMPFIMATADPSQELVQAAVKLDVNGFITKPISLNMVLKAIHLAFGRPCRLKAAADYAKVALPAEGGAEILAS